MKAEDISEAFNEINEDYIESANEIRKPKLKKSSLIKWCSAIAAIAVICFIAAKAFNINAPIVYETDEGKTQYGGYDLPILEILPDNAISYGYEAYMAYDIYELENKNPWNKNTVFETLPVFKNTSCNEVGIAYPGIGEEAMLKKIDSLTDGDHGTLKYTRIGDFTSGTGIPNDFVCSIEATFGNCTIEISSNGEIIGRYNGFDGIALPEEYNFTHSNTTDEEAFKAIAYIYENYGSIIGLNEATFVTTKEYTYSGDEIRSYKIYDFSGDEINDMLNFAFSEIQLAPDDFGNLMLIRINDKLSCGEKIADYPIISIEEATDMLIFGGYITTVPYEMPGKEYIARTELLYRSGSGENIWMPYYRFLVELPECEQENGLKSFGAYYVPAVESEYISGLELWNGNFN